MPRVVHFELPSDHPERAVRFYTQVFGWTIEKWNGPVDYWLVKTGEESERGIDGGIMGRGPLHATTNTVAVTDVDDYARRVIGAGGRVVRPKMAIPGVGWHAYCVDTEGNVFGILQADEAAR